MIPLVVDMPNGSHHLLWMQIRLPPKISQCSMSAIASERLGVKFRRLKEIFYATRNLEGINQLWPRQHSRGSLLSHAAWKRHQVEDAAEQRPESDQIQTHCGSRRQGSAVGRDRKRIRVPKGRIRG